MTASVLPDANVLFSRTIRDWLFLLSCEGAVYTVHSTVDILSEVLANYRKQFPHASGEQVAAIDRTLRQNLHSIFSDYVVSGSPVADVFDHHVHAAASQGRMMYLVTSDRDFLDLPDEVKDSLEYEVFSPDDFFCLVDDTQHLVVRQVSMSQLLYWSGRASNGFDSKSLPKALKDAGCPNFAERIQSTLTVELQIPVEGGFRKRVVALG